MGKKLWLIVLEFPSFVRRGGGEVEPWSGNTWVPPCNLSPRTRLYPTLILPLQRGGDLPNGISEKTRGTNTHGKLGSAKYPLQTISNPIANLVGGSP